MVCFPWSLVAVAGSHNVKVTDRWREREVVSLLLQHWTDAEVVETLSRLLSTNLNDWSMPALFYIQGGWACKFHSPIPIGLFWIRQGCLGLPREEQPPVSVIRHVVFFPPSGNRGYNREFIESPSQAMPFSALNCSWGNFLKSKVREALNRTNKLNAPFLS